MTIRYKDTAWKRIDDGRTDGQTDRRTDGHPESIGPQPLGLGPNSNVRTYEHKARGGTIENYLETLTGIEPATPRLHVIVLRTCNLGVAGST